jgi:hypothetical protein
MKIWTRGGAAFVVFALGSAALAIQEGHIPVNLFFNNF